MQAKKLTNADLSKARSSIWMPKKEMLKFNTNCVAYVDGQGHLEATSYGHWAIITEKNGLYFFNWYSYSRSTSKHQHKISSLVRDLGIEYITVKYRSDIRSKYIEDILNDKIDQLYTSENELALSRATKHAVYSESEFNSLLSEIKNIAAASGVSDTRLSEMLFEAELEATLAMFNGLCDKLELENLRKEYSVQKESLEAIAI